jgi:hypothetical protein
MPHRRKKLTTPRGYDFDVCLLVWMSLAMGRAIHDVSETKSVSLIRADGGCVQGTGPRAPTPTVSASGGPWEHRSKWHWYGWRTERRLRVKLKQMCSRELTPRPTPGVSSSQAQSTDRHESQVCDLFCLQYTLQEHVTQN